MITKIGSYQYGKSDYLIDTEAEVSSLPTTDGPGSMALCIENSGFYILSGAKEWKLFISGGDE